MRVFYTMKCANYSTSIRTKMRLTAGPCPDLLGELNSALQTSRGIGGKRARRGQREVWNRRGREKGKERGGEGIEV